MIIRIFLLIRIINCSKYHFLVGIDDFKLNCYIDQYKEAFFYGFVNVLSNEILSKYQLQDDKEALSLFYKLVLNNCFSKTQNDLTNKKECTKYFDLIDDHILKYYKQKIHKKLSIKEHERYYLFIENSQKCCLETFRKFFKKILNYFYYKPIDTKKEIQFTYSSQIYKKCNNSLENIKITYEFAYFLFPPFTNFNTINEIKMRIFSSEHFEYLLQNKDGKINFKYIIKPICVTSHFFDMQINRNGKLESLFTSKDQYLFKYFESEFFTACKRFAKIYYSNQINWNFFKYSKLTYNQSKPVVDAQLYMKIYIENIQLCKFVNFCIGEDLIENIKYNTENEIPKSQMFYYNFVQKFDPLNNEKFNSDELYNELFFNFFSNKFYYNIQIQLHFDTVPITAQGNMINTYGTGDLIDHLYYKIVASVFNFFSNSDNYQYFEKRKKTFIGRYQEQFFEKIKLLDDKIVIKNVIKYFELVEYVCLENNNLLCNQNTNIDFDKILGCKITKMYFDLEKINQVSEESVIKKTLFFKDLNIYELNVLEYGYYIALKEFLHEKMILNLLKDQNHSLNHKKILQTFSNSITTQTADENISFFPLRIIPNIFSDFIITLSMVFKNTILESKLIEKENSPKICIFISIDAFVITAIEKDSKNVLSKFQDFLIRYFFINKINMKNLLSDYNIYIKKKIDIHFSFYYEKKFGILNAIEIVCFDLNISVELFLKL